MAQPTNQLQGFLAVFAQKSLEQFIADMPLLGRFTTDFSDSIANGGISVTSRLPISTFSMPNDTAANGYLAMNASSSQVTITLKQRDYTQDFTELQWATVTPQVIQNTFLPSMVKQLANGILVDALSQITASSVSPAIQLVNVTGSSSTTVFSASNAMTKNEVPFNDRMIICSPDFYQSLIGSINPAYVYGATTAIQDYHGIRLGGFDPIFEYPRLTGTTSAGGSSYGVYQTGKVLHALALQKQALVVAMRAPVDVNNGLVQTATATDPSSGISLQVRLMYDIPRGVWKIAVTSIYGVALGNPLACVPVVV
jgi:hypothetical protein